LRRRWRLPPAGSQVRTDTQRKALDAQLDELFGTSADDLEAPPAPRSKVSWPPLDASMTTLVHLFGISPNVLDLVGKSLVFALLLALAIGIQFANMGLVRVKSSTNGDEKTPARDAPTLHSAPGKGDASA